MSTTDQEKKLLWIDIWWDGPLTIERALKLHGDMDYGVYQAYGAHPVYGSSTLLYIGRAYDQKFGERFRQHGFERESPDPEHLEFYLGRLRGDVPQEEDWRRSVYAAEALLIYAHSPAWNSSGIDSFSPELVRGVHVFNWGARRGLMPEVSGRRWLGEAGQEVESAAFFEWDPKAQ